MSVRTALFLDYQNVYRGARDLFDLESRPHMDGQIHPWLLGERIVQKSAHRDRRLDHVRVYRGRPDATKDPKGLWGQPAGSATHGPADKA